LTFTGQIKEQAHALGFDLAGIAPAEPSAYAAFYARWLASGYHGTMTYLARPDAVARRVDPQALLPGARTWISVACNYCGPEPPALPDGGPAGLVARYARGEDYHQVFSRRLRRLRAWIREHAPEPATVKIYADTSAVLEREVAQRAGLGWIGKNTLLINPRHGSWFLLGELLLDLRLDYDEPVTVDRCGTCTRCLTACPTGCILPGRVLDATRCLAYLTIEWRGEIPDGQVPALGNRTFGCDVCQEVCPWNRFARPSEDPAWQPGPHAQADLIQWAELSEEEFRARFRGTAIRRAGRDGLVRNARAALGNVKRKT
jgi:epoxyqueuosine reductase